MLLAKRVFRLAGIYGLLVLLPQYFLEDQIEIHNPPQLTHPEFYYGFLGVAISWQIAFLMIGRNPIRYRPLMIPAILEKFTFGIAAWVLYDGYRVRGPIVAFATIDLILGLLFIAAYLATKRCAIAVGGTTEEQVW